VHAFAFFLCGSFDFARDTAESLSDALEFSSETSVFFGLYVVSLSLSSEWGSVVSSHIRLGLYISSKRQTSCSLHYCFRRPCYHLPKPCILSVETVSA